MVIILKSDEIEKVEPFDIEEDSIFIYEDKVRDIIDKRILELKNLLSNDWNSMSDACYELFKAYQFLLDALEKCGKSSKSIIYAKDAIEYLTKYQMYINSMDIKRFSDSYIKIIKRYKVNL